MGILELEHVSKQFPGQRAVDDVSLSVDRGSFFSLLGPSGCGKTTTLRLVAGFEEPTSGEILLSGRRINHLPPYQRSVSTVFQSYALFPHLTVRENVEFGLRRKGVREPSVAVNRMLEMLQLTSKAARLPSQISGGERQRTALARSLVIEPDVLLLDEPLSALDPNLRKQVRAELKSLQRRTGVTFLLVTHDQEEALTLSDQIAVLDGGKLSQVGSPQDLYLRPENRFVAGFLGAVNWIGPVGVRPEAMHLSHEIPQSACSLPGVIEGSTFLGNCVHVQARLNQGGRVTAEVSRSTGEYREGEPVHVWWQAADELRLPEQP